MSHDKFPKCIKMYYACKESFISSTKCIGKNENTFDTGKTGIN